MNKFPSLCYNIAAIHKNRTVFRVCNPNYTLSWFFFLSRLHHSNLKKNNGKCVMEITRPHSFPMCQLHILPGFSKRWKVCNCNYTNTKRANSNNIFGCDEHYFPVNSIRWTHGCTTYIWWVTTEREEREESGTLLNFLFSTRVINSNIIKCKFNFNYL